MTKYEAIFRRRSVRKYDDTPVTDAELAVIRAYLDGVKQLPGQRVKFEIVSGGALKGGIAPYAILAYADGADAAKANIGCVLQDVDLWLQASGYGSVWCGMAKPASPAPDYRISLGFGKTSVPLRGAESDFKRKKLSEISDADNAAAQAARLAPSAVNLQPWKLSFADGEITVKASPGLAARAIPGKMYLIDLGIATRHAAVALEHEGKAVTEIDVIGSGKSSATKIKYAVS
jgi:nitroreductase